MDTITSLQCDILIIVVSIEDATAESIRAQLSNYYTEAPSMSNIYYTIQQLEKLEYITQTGAIDNKQVYSATDTGEEALGQYMDWIEIMFSMKS